ncbi:MAG: hypothetical protein ABI591_33685 [Kofleriaceae bacterium]
MAISSISGVASVPTARPVDAERQPRDRKETAHDKQHEEDRASAETPADDPAAAPDGEHHIHVIA